MASDGVDGSVFDELVEEIGLDGAQQTFAIFVSETDSRLDRLAQMRLDKDREAIKQEAHALKGSAGNFGLRRVSDLAKMLEQNATTIATGDYETTLRGLAASYAAARRVLAKASA